MSINFFTQIPKQEESAFIASYKRNVKELFKKHIEVLKNLKEGEKLVFTFNGELQRENSTPLLRTVYNFSQGWLWSKENQNSRNIEDLFNAMAVTSTYYQSRFLSRLETDQVFNDLDVYQSSLKTLGKTYSNISGKKANEEIINKTIEAAQILQGIITKKNYDKQNKTIHEFLRYEIDSLATSYKEEINHKSVDEKEQIYLKYVHQMASLFLIEPNDLSDFINTPYASKYKKIENRMSLIQSLIRHLQVGRSQYSQAFIIAKLFFDLLVEDADREWANMRNCHMSIKEFESLYTQIIKLPQELKSLELQKKLLIDFGFPADQIY